MKKIVLMVLGIMLFSLLASNVFATWNCPAATNYLRGTLSGATCELRSSQNINWTAANQGANNITNVTFQYSQDGTNFVFIGINGSLVGANGTAADPNTGRTFSISFNTLSYGNIYDNATLTLRAVPGNRTLNQTAEDVVVNIDNSNPIFTTHGSVTGTIGDPDQVITATVFNATACTLVYDGKSYTGTLANNICTARGYGMEENGAYNFTATDGANVTQGNNNLLTVEIGSYVTGTPTTGITTIITPAEQKRRNDKFIIFGVLFATMVSTALVFSWKKIKKKFR